MTEQIARTEKQLGAILRRTRKQMGLSQGALGERFHLQTGHDFPSGGGRASRPAAHADGDPGRSETRACRASPQPGKPCANRGSVLNGSQEGARPAERVPERTPRRRAASRIHGSDRFPIRRRLAGLAEHLSGFTVPAAARRPLCRRTGRQRLRQPPSRQRQYPQTRRRARRRAWHRRLQPSDGARP